MQQEKAALKNTIQLLSEKERNALKIKELNTKLSLLQNNVEDFVSQFESHRNYFYPVKNQAAFDAKNALQSYR